jgi:hypothetical protein
VIAPTQINEGIVMKVRPIRLGQAAFAALSMALLFATPGHAVTGGGQVTAGISAPPGGRIVVDVLTVNGSGCPAGTATVSVSRDNTSFRVRYRSYVAQAGGTSRPTDFRKNCQLSLAVHVPQGFTFAIARADHRGTADLKRGVSGLLRSAYYFMGSSDTRFVDHPLPGPFKGGWRATDVTPVAALVFAPCGKKVNLNVNTELRVRAGARPTAKSFMRMGSTTGDIDTIYQFSWKSCR